MDAAGQSGAFQHLHGQDRAALVFGDLMTGAESDIQQLTRIARHMVGRWGMSRAIGPIAVLPMIGLGTSMVSLPVPICRIQVFPAAAAPKG